VPAPGYPFAWLPLPASVPVRVSVLCALSGLCTALCLCCGAGCVHRDRAHDVGVLRRRAPAAAAVPRAAGAVRARQSRPAAVFACMNSCTSVSKNEWIYVCTRVCVSACDYTCCPRSNTQALMAYFNSRVDPSTGILSVTGLGDWCVRSDLLPCGSPLLLPSLTPPAGLPVWRLRWRARLYLLYSLCVPVC
jgi:hypothetical protein